MIDGIEITGPGTGWLVNLIQAYYIRKFTG